MLCQSSLPYFLDRILKIPPGLCIPLIICPPAVSYRRLTVREDENLLQGIPQAQTGYKEIASKGFKPRSPNDLQISSARRFRPGDVYDAQVSSLWPVMLILRELHLLPSVVFCILQ